MKNLLVASSILFAAATSYAQPGPDQPAASCCSQTTQTAQTTPVAPATQVAVAPAAQPAQPQTTDDEGWHAPPGQRFLHGFRLGYMYLQHADALNREKDGQMVSIKDKYGLKTPHMMLLGYEGFYRIIGHSWLNVLIVGNVTVAGLEQSKFIPAASGLIGFEFDRSFQLGVGVNVTPDPDAPTHAIFAAGWTPRVGSIHTPVHVFYVPEPSTTDMNGKEVSGNSRFGATVGVTW